MWPWCVRLHKNGGVILLAPTCPRQFGAGILGSQQSRPSHIHSEGERCPHFRSSSLIWSTNTLPLRFELVRRPQWLRPRAHCKQSASKDHHRRGARSFRRTTKEWWWRLWPLVVPQVENMAADAAARGFCRVESRKHKRSAAMLAAETDAARCDEILDNEIRESLTGLADSIS